MADNSVPLTRKGMAEFQKELKHLRTVRRQELAEQLHRSKEAATMQYDAEYEDAKNDQAFVEGRILTIEKLLRNASIIDEESAHHTNRVQLGSHVHIEVGGGSKHDYVIVGPAEADPARGWISNESPVGRALLGKSIGDDIETMVPAGTMKLKIMAID